jgi:hypothetical protein
VEELILSEDPVTGEISRLTRFLSGADSAAFGGKAPSAATKGAWCQTSPFPNAPWEAETRPYQNDSSPPFNQELQILENQQVEPQTARNKSVSLFGLIGEEELSEAAGKSLEGFKAMRF